MTSLERKVVADQRPSRRTGLPDSETSEGRCMNSNEYRDTIKYIRSCTAAIFSRLQTRVGKSESHELLPFLLELRNGKSPNDYPSDSREKILALIVVERIYDHRGWGGRSNAR